MPSPLHLRLMTPSDLAFANQVRELAGWNQTLADWERFLATEPQGCFLAEWEGAPAGTATTTIHSPALAWIGMVLVHPDYRRLGIGRALLERCLGYLRGRQVRCIKLDATPLGKKVYDGLGFKDEWSLSRWTSAAPQIPALNSPHLIRNWRATDACAFEALDRQAFGVARMHILPDLVQQSDSSLVMESQTGKLAGMGLLRKGSRALYLGPVVADSPAAGIGLIETLLRRYPMELIYWDIPDANAAAVAWAQQAGFTVQRSLMRMYLGENSAPGDPHRQFALAGPELG